MKYKKTIFSVLSGILIFAVILKLILSGYFTVKNLNKMSESTIYATDFEVFGIVQGVFFRKYTESKANELGIRGWCMNTRNDTVKGQLEGPINKIKEMQEWLRTTGSPQSRIDKAVFSELKEIPDYTFKNFSIRR